MEAERRIADAAAADAAAAAAAAAVAAFAARLKPLLDEAETFSTEPACPQKLCFTKAALDDLTRQPSDDPICFPASPNPSVVFCVDIAIAYLVLFWQARVDAATKWSIVLSQVPCDNENCGSVLALCRKITSAGDATVAVGSTSSEPQAPATEVPVPEAGLFPPPPSSAVPSRGASMDYSLAVRLGSASSPGRSSLLSSPAVVPEASTVAVGCVSPPLNDRQSQFFVNLQSQNLTNKQAPAIERGDSMAQPSQEAKATEYNRDMEKACQVSLNEFNQMNAEKELEADQLYSALKQSAVESPDQAKQNNKTRKQQRKQEREETEKREAERLEAATAAEKKHVTEEADAALRAALDSKDLDLLVAAINEHGDHASPEVLEEARSARVEIKDRRKKAARLEKREAERLENQRAREKREEEDAQRRANQLNEQEAPASLASELPVVVVPGDLLSTQEISAIVDLCSPGSSASEHVVVDPGDLLSTQENAILSNRASTIADCGHTFPTGLPLDEIVVTVMRCSDGRARHLLTLVCKGWSEVVLRTTRQLDQKGAWSVNRLLLTHADLPWDQFARLKTKTFKQIVTLVSSKHDPDDILNQKWSKMKINLEQEFVSIAPRMWVNDLVMDLALENMAHQLSHENKLRICSTDEAHSVIVFDPVMWSQIQRGLESADIPGVGNVHNFTDQDAAKCRRSAILKGVTESRCVDWMSTFQSAVMCISALVINGHWGWIICDMNTKEILVGDPLRSWSHDFCMNIGQIMKDVLRQIDHRLNEKRGKHFLNSAHGWIDDLTIVTNTHAKCASWKTQRDGHSCGPLTLMTIFEYGVRKQLPDSQDALRKWQMQADLVRTNILDIILNGDTRIYRRQPDVYQVESLRVLWQVAVTIFNEQGKGQGKAQPPKGVCQPKAQTDIRDFCTPKGRRMTNKLEESVVEDDVDPAAADDESMFEVFAAITDVPASDVRKLLDENAALCSAVHCDFSSVSSHAVHNNTAFECFSTVFNSPLRVALIDEDQTLIFESLKPALGAKLNALRRCMSTIETIKDEQDIDFFLPDVNKTANVLKRSVLKDICDVVFGGRHLTSLAEAHDQKFAKGVFLRRMKLNWKLASSTIKVRNNRVFLSRVKWCNGQMIEATNDDMLDSDDDETDSDDDDSDGPSDGNETESVDGNETESVDSDETESVDGNETESDDDDDGTNGDSAGAAEVLEVLDSLGSQDDGSWSGNDQYTPSSEGPTVGRVLIDRNLLLNNRNEAGLISPVPFLTTPTPGRGEREATKHSVEEATKLPLTLCSWKLELERMLLDDSDSEPDEDLPANRLDDSDSEPDEDLPANRSTVDDHALERCYDCSQDPSQDDDLPANVSTVESVLHDARQNAGELTDVDKVMLTKRVFTIDNNWVQLMASTTRMSNQYRDDTSGEPLAVKRDEDDYMILPRSANLLDLWFRRAFKMNTLPGLVLVTDACSPLISSHTTSHDPTEHGTEAEENDSPELAMALNLISMGRNVIITGGAGVGKTTSLTRIQPRVSTDEVATTATTAAAADVMHLKGIDVYGTIHGFQGATKFTSTFASLQKSHNYKHGGRERLKVVKKIIIDEISMLDPMILEMLNKALQDAKENDAPFGGAQIVLIGDPLQLPPVEGECIVNDKHLLESQYGFVPVTLTKVYRQEDQLAVQLLNELRRGTLNWSLIEQLRLTNTLDVREENFSDTFCAPEYLRSRSDSELVIAATNAEIDRINLPCLETRSAQNPDRTASAFCKLTVKLFRKDAKEVLPCDSPSEPSPASDDLDSPSEPSPASDDLVRSREILPTRITRFLQGREQQKEMSPMCWLKRAREGS